MRHLIVFSVVLFVLSACDVAFGPEPTATPTASFAVLEPSPTFDIQPPTELPNTVPQHLDGVNNPTAAAAAAHSPLTSSVATLDPSRRPVLVTVPLTSDLLLNGELWLPLQPVSAAPGILLLGSTFEGWGGFPSNLRDLGYAVLTVEGAPLADPAATVRAIFDVMAVQPGIDAARLLVVGAQAGADAGLIGCADDARCLAVVLLSPQVGADLEAAMRDYNPRPVLLTASQEDSASLRAAERVRQTATGSALLQPLEGAGRGVQILTSRPDVVTLIGEFLDTVTGR